MFWTLLTLKGLFEQKLLKHLLFCFIEVVMTIFLGQLSL